MAGRCALKKVTIQPPAEAVFLYLTTGPDVCLAAVWGKSMTTVTTEVDMLNQIWEELRHIRKRLDDHVDREDQDLSAVKRDISSIRENMAAHKTRLGIISAGISIAIAAFVSWLGLKVQ